MPLPSKPCPQFFTPNMDIRADTMPDGSVALMWTCSDCDWLEPLTDEEEAAYYAAQEEDSE